MKSSNEELVSLVRFLKVASNNYDAGIWKSVAEQLERSGGLRAEVNIGKISRHTSPKETVIVPGKVLGAGMIDHPVNIAAFGFSASAEKAVVEAGGTCLSIRDLVKSNPSGSKIKLIR